MRLKIFVTFAKAFLLIISLAFVITGYLPVKGVDSLSNWLIISIIIILFVKCLKIVEMIIAKIFELQCNCFKDSHSNVCTNLCHLVFVFILTVVFLIIWLKEYSNFCFFLTVSKNYVNL